MDQADLSLGLRMQFPSDLPTALPEGSRHVSVSSNKHLQDMYRVYRMLRNAAREPTIPNNIAVLATDRATYDKEHAAIAKTFEPRLAWEIMVLIFEGLCDSPYLRGMRLVSSQFDHLIIPIVYRRVNLTPGLLESYVSTALKPDLFMGSGPVEEISRLYKVTPVYLQMALFTKHMTIDRELDFDDVGILLKDLDTLTSIKWSYWDPDDTLANPSYILPRKPIDQPDIEPAPLTQGRGAVPQLLIEELNVASPHTEWLKIEPPQLLTSIKLFGWRRWDNHDIRTILLEQPGLETVHLIGARQPILSACPTFEDRNIGGEERMPAVKELVLRNYYWGHSPDIAVKFWDWTRVTHLVLGEVTLINFLRTVPPKHLLQLKNLVLDEESKEHLEELTTLTCDLVHKVHALSDLGLRCKVRKLITPILKHGPTLRSIQIFDYTAPSRHNLTTLLVSDVEAITAACPSLMEFSLEAFFMGDVGPAEAIRVDDFTLCKMRNLRALKFYTRLVESKLPSAKDKDSYAHLDTMVRDWLPSFLLAKQGAKFDMIYINLRVFAANSSASTKVKWAYYDELGLQKPVFQGP